MTSQELYELLQECDYSDFDPIKEVFKILDVQHTNQISVDYLVSLMKNFNIRKIDEKEKDLILECLDLDKDGKIGYADIEQLLQGEFLDFGEKRDEEKENQPEQK